MSKSPTAGNAPRRMSSTSRKEKVSILVILGRQGLSEYYQYFEQAGITMFDATAHPSDVQVDKYIVDVEDACGIEFDQSVRANIWKALRFSWFRGPGHIKSFIERSQVRRLFLPKIDYKQVDSMVRFPEVDPDRRRQFIRTTKPSDQPSFRGPAVINIQYEVYKRLDDVAYEVADVERSVMEWQNRNPRTMLREDPREEIMRLRLCGLQEFISYSLLERSKRTLTQRRMQVCLFGLRIFFLLLTYLMCGVAAYHYKAAAEEIMLKYILMSRQVLSAAMFFVTYTVALGVAQRWHPDPQAVKLKRWQYSCQRLIEYISDFRVETESARVAQEDNFEERDLTRDREVRVATSKKDKIEKKERGSEPRRRRRKKEKDECLAMWTGKATVKKNWEGQKAIIRQHIEDSHKRIEKISVDCKWLGGNRMASYAKKVGMPENHEDKLRFRPMPPKAPPLSAMLQLRGLAAPRSRTGMQSPAPPSLPSWPSSPSSPIGSTGSLAGGRRRNSWSATASPAGFPAVSPSGDFPRNRRRRKATGDTEPLEDGVARSRSRSLREMLEMEVGAASGSGVPFQESDPWPGEFGDPDAEPDLAQTLHPWQAAGLPPLPGSMPPTQGEMHGRPE